MATEKGLPHEHGDVTDLRAKLVELHARDGARERELNRLSVLLQQLTQMSAIENILTNGFEELSGKLGHVEVLTPKREPLGRDGELRLKSLVDSLARPKWSGVAALSVPNETVFFIGQKVPHLQQTKGGMAS